MAKLYIFSDAVNGKNFPTSSKLILNSDLVERIDSAASPVVYRCGKTLQNAVITSANGGTTSPTWNHALRVSVVKVNDKPIDSVQVDVQFSNILYIKTVGSYTLIYTKEGFVYSTETTLTSIINTIEAYGIPGVELGEQEEQAVQALIDAATGDLGGNTVIQHVDAITGDLGGDTVMQNIEAVSDSIPQAVTDEITAQSLVDSTAAISLAKSVFNQSVFEGTIVADGSGNGGGPFGHGFNLDMNKRSHIVVKAFGSVSSIDIPLTLTNYQSHSVDYTFTGAAPGETVYLLAYNLSQKI